MSVRAKFHCASIRLVRASRTKDGYTWDHSKGKYLGPDGQEVATSTEVYESWDQPTVELRAVTASGGGENAVFFAATPSARCELTITNPDAAEFFELGKEYYLDFSAADA